MFHCNMVSIIIIIITILVINFIQGIYNYTPDTNHVSRVYADAAVLYLQFVPHVKLCRPWNVLALPVECVQCPTISLFSEVP